MATELSTATPPSITPAESGEISEEVLGLLQSAVRIARDRQVRTVAQLKSLMAEYYPGKEAEINRAISHWAKYVQATKSYEELAHG
jgi:hypothetical protein